MVRDGIVYAAALVLLGAVAASLGGLWWAIPEGLLALFVLYFFRDPKRIVPPGALVVSPADGRVVDRRLVRQDGQDFWKVSIFLSLFDVHVNRAPISGVIRSVSYQPGRFRIASRPEASVENEQNTVMMEGEGLAVTFKQIAGLLARRIVFRKKIGDQAEIGERVGLIKFGSRVDIFLPADLPPQVQMGERVRGGLSILARCQDRASARPAPAAMDSVRACGKLQTY
ncbi:MAG TPA: phosphatidylserine decarboxylase [Candidatus Glassbacteria bacterium]|nr:phosphatidylserine decarboxylase [Candidatus Glassbacteria bacterium]